MRRRDFITLVGGAAAWSHAVRAEQQAATAVGFLNSAKAETNQEYSLKRLKRVVAGQNIHIEYRWANGEYDRLPALAAELVRRSVAVIATLAPVATFAARQATTAIPIVFTIGSDPVKEGLVSSLGRSGNNLTGVTFFANLLDAKRVDLLHLLVPGAKRIAVLVNPKDAEAQLQRDETQKTARSVGLETVLLEASTEDEIDKVMASLAQRHADALHVAADAFLTSRTGLIIKSALGQSLPTSFAFRQQAVAGGLMSYGASITEAVRLFRQLCCAYP